MNIRQATLDDIDGLAVLFDAYRIFYRQDNDIGGAKTFLTERLSQHESVVFVAEAEQTLVGFTQLYPVFSSTRMQRTWLLNDLYVAESCRCGGVGLALIDAAKQHAKATNALGLMLETAKTNAPGNHLYPKAGFILDTAHNYYNWNVIE